MKEECWRAARIHNQWLESRYSSPYPLVQWLWNEDVVFVRFRGLHAYQFQLQQKVRKMPTENTQRAHTDRFDVLLGLQPHAGVIVLLPLCRPLRISVPFLISHSLFIHLPLVISPLLVILLVHCGCLFFCFQQCIVSMSEVD